VGRTQRIVVVGVCALTALALGALVAGVPTGIVRVLDVANSAALFVIAASVRMVHREQRLILVALGLSALGDLFLSRVLPAPGGAAGMAGMACFLAAYVALTLALLRGRPGPWEALLVVPFLGSGTAVVWALKDELTGAFLLAVPLFLLVITMMAWAATTTLVRTYFVPRVRWWAAIGATVIFASDAAVAFEMFHLPFSSQPPMGLQLFVRASYVAGWLLMLLIACDPVLRDGAGADEPVRG
jgi:uncharacterized membrane protein YhhN